MREGAWTTRLPCLLRKPRDRGGLLVKSCAAQAHGPFPSLVRPEQCSVAVLSHGIQRFPSHYSLTSWKASAVFPWGYSTRKPGTNKAGLVSTFACGRCANLMWPSASPSMPLSAAESQASSGPGLI